MAWPPDGFSGEGRPNIEDMKNETQSKKLLVIVDEWVHFSLAKGGHG
jgi:hypothetical protein